MNAGNKEDEADEHPAEECDRSGVQHTGSLLHLGASLSPGRALNVLALTALPVEEHPS